MPSDVKPIAAIMSRRLSTLAASTEPSAQGPLSAGVVVAHMPTPWREITDGGVVLNLVVGVSALLWFSFSAWALGKPPSRWASADFPEDVSLIVSGQKPAPSVVQTKDACETYPSVAQDPQPVAAV